MEVWIDFYRDYFSSVDEAKKFVEELENINDRSIPRHRSKIMMHQAQRLVSLSDDVLSIRKGRQSLQLMFLIICAENIAKLFHDFEGEGQSKAHVRKFFYDLVEENDRETLKSGFTSFERKTMEFNDIISCLYSVRCDVVHEGQYWGFNFSDKGTPMMNSNPDVIVGISFSEFRDIIVRGCINAVQKYRSC